MFRKRNTRLLQKNRVVLDVRRRQLKMVVLVDRFHKIRLKHWVDASGSIGYCRFRSAQYMRSITQASSQLSRGSNDDTFVGIGSLVHDASYNADWPQSWRLPRRRGRREMHMWLLDPHSRRSAGVSIGPGVVVAKNGEGQINDM